MINLFLDDCRDAPNYFVIARTVKDAWYLLQNCKVNMLSLDHDLGETETGYDLTKLMVEYNVYPSKAIYLHTANPVGRDNMYQLLMRYKPDSLKVYRCPIMED